MEFIDGFRCGLCGKHFQNWEVNLADGQTPQHRNSQRDVCESAGEKALPAIRQQTNLKSKSCLEIK